MDKIIYWDRCLMIIFKGKTIEELNDLNNEECEN